LSISKVLFVIRYSVFIILLSGKTFAAVSAPSIRCLGVNSVNGNVDIGWVIPTDPLSEFFSYHIFSSSNKNGPYTDIATISTYAQNSYTDLGTTANAASEYYYIVTHYGALGSSLSAPSDTLQSIYLQVNPLVNNAIAGLIWNAVHAPNLPTNSKYYIYKEYPAGSWNLIDSTISLSYSDTNNTVCATTLINYRIEVKNTSGCSSISNVAGRNFKDDQAPLPPNIQQVSVNIGTGKANIIWYGMPSKDVVKYYIYKIDKFNNYVLIDSVLTPSLTYSYNLSIADKESEGYSIAAIDDCKNIGPFPLGHFSIYATDSIDICNSKVFIKWNAYTRWKQGVDSYEIYVSENNGAYTLLQTLTGNITSYTHSTLTPFSKYRYYIRAIEKNGAGISTSNVTQSVYYRIPKPPLFLDIVSASVNNADQFITLICNIDITAGSKYYKILRSTDNVTFTQIAKLPAIFTPQLTYVDNTVNTASTSYYYKVVATDSCDVDYKTSTYVRTMLLKVTSSVNLSNTLIWNDYEGFLGTINIYRGIDNVYTVTPIATVNYGVNTYTDDVKGLLVGNGAFCYYVEATNGTDKSNSNIACAAQKPILFVPNAFTPNGDALNDVFMPKSAFIGTGDYSLIIYNRWGKPIYESHDPQIGWDGKINGEDSQIGVYAYIIRYTATNGDAFEKKGSFSLLR
jgi:gliding motility-associated-like protein